MKKLVMMMALVLGSAAHADGFVCENLAENLKIRVFNKTNPEQGVRNAAIMIVSDPSVLAGNKTTATFEADNSVLTNDAAVYTAMVDLRRSGSDLKGRNLAGTK